jgi:hypothetical protein
MKKSTPPRDTPSIPGDLEAYKLIQTWSLAFQNRGEDRGWLAIGFFARHALKELLSLSERGHKKPLEFLVGILLMSVEEFDSYCRRELSHLPKDYDRRRYPDGLDIRDFARRKWVWPGLLSHDTDMVKGNKELVRELGLANDVGVNFTEKSKRMWTRGTPEVVVALRLRNIVEEYRTQFQFKQMTKTHLGYGQATSPFIAGWEQSHPWWRQTKKLAQKLPSLDRKNYAAWFKAAEPVFIGLYGKDFENHEHFAHIRRNAEQMSVKEKKKQRGLVRREIRKRIRQAFKSIAPIRSGI